MVHVHVSVVYLQCVVPASCAESGTIRGHAQTADPVLVGVQYRHAVTLQHVPDVDGVVVVATKQKTTYKTHTMKTLVIGDDLDYNSKLNVGEEDDLSYIKD